MIITVLPDGHIWLRVTKPEYVDPFDMSFAAEIGGRWNPPGSWATLYLNEDMATVHAQVAHMFTDRSIDPDDLDDDAPIQLAAATLPRRQRVVDAVDPDGIASLGLSTSYPYDDDGALITHQVTQAVGVAVHEADLRGVWCRSASGVGNEFAWFPAAHSTARPVWSSALSYGRWRHAATFDQIDTE